MVMWTQCDFSNQVLQGSPNASLSFEDYEFRVNNMSGKNCRLPASKDELLSFLRPDGRGGYQPMDMCRNQTAWAPVGRKVGDDFEDTDWI